jgi:hypothetical protein
LPNRGRNDLFPTSIAQMASLPFALYQPALLGELGVAGKSKASAVPTKIKSST